MKNEILKFELKTWKKSPIFYLLLLSFFLFSMITMLGTGGFFDEPVAFSQNVKLLNSPYSLSFVSFLFAKFLLFAIAIFGGFGLYRDYKNKTHSVLYSYPISKFYYLNGKLGSTVILISLLCCVTVLGVLLSELLLGTNNPKIGNFDVLGYLVALGVYLIPSLVVIGVFVFVTVGITRNIFSGFIVVTCFVLFQLILENLLFENRAFLAILDPFGQNAFQLATKDWGITIQNSSNLPMSFYVVINRVLWLMIALFIYSCFVKKFDFQYDSILQFKRKSNQPKNKNLTQNQTIDYSTEIKFDFSVAATVKTFLFLLLFDFRSLVKNWMFILVSIFGAVTILLIQLKVCNTGELILQPLTRILIGAPLRIYMVILTVTTFLFSGIIMNKSRQSKMNLMLDVTPVNNWQLIFSKIGAISLLHITQLLIFLLVCLAIQIINGFYRFEFGLYFFHIIILVFPILFVWNLTSHFIHSVFPNIFLALFVLLGIWFGAQSLDVIGIKTNILKFNYLPAIEYTDFDGYGYQLKGYLVLLSYWLIFGLILGCGTLLVWNRGIYSSVRERFSVLRSRLTLLISFGIVLLAINFVWMASFIYKKENFDNVNNSSKNTLNEYKQKWKKYADIKQPKITDIQIELNINPEEESFDASVQYQLINKSKNPIDTIFIRTGFDEITQIHMTNLGELILEDTVLKSYLYKLSKPLQSGDSLEVLFNIKNTPNTFFTRNSNVLKDGTYIKHDILPRLGYQFIDAQLTLNDSLVNNYNFYSRDADYVNIKTIISTSNDQTAIAPGELIKHNIYNDRNVFEYKTLHPVKFNFSFHSSMFEIIEEKFDDINIQLYCKNGHEQNAPDMIKGIKASLNYNTRLFGEYPYSEIRIIEFPHTEERFSATLTANNIPTSEILFNVNAEFMNDNFNLPFYVMAHEVTHEWFGNQVMPADAEGAKMLTESITEYLTLCIFRDYYSDDYANNFLEVQQDRYENGRKKEHNDEMPLNKVHSHQEYIAYGKGAIAFNEIANEIGIEKLSSVLNMYVSLYNNDANYYPTSDDLIDLLKAHTIVDKHEIIDHWLTETNPLNY